METFPLAVLQDRGFPAGQERLMKIVRLESALGGDDDPAILGAHVVPECARRRDGHVVLGVVLHIHVSISRSISRSVCVFWSGHHDRTTRAGGITACPAGASTRPCRGAGPFPSWIPRRRPGSSARSPAGPAARGRATTAVCRWRSGRPDPAQGS